MKRIYVIAGEPSGDLHGAHLVEAMKKLDNRFQFRGFGGPRMEQAGVQLDQTIDKLSFMGFAEVVKHLPMIFSNIRMAKSTIRTWNPDAIVYIDFPGFNMRIARWARKHGYKNFYYIAPQAWAWKEKRALKLKRDVDEMFCILPFERSFFAGFDYDVHYVGHPLVDIIREYRKDHIADSATIIQTRHLTDENTEDRVAPKVKKKIIALLPGSRQQEVTKILPAQIQAVVDLTDFEIVIGKSPHVPRSFYDAILEKTNVQRSRVEFEEQTYRLLSRAHIACVASGTATLETALFKVPQVVCFRGSNISYRIAKHLIKVPYISLVNLVMDEEVVKELIQEDLNPSMIRKEVVRLADDNCRDRMLHQYKLLERKLGLGGAAEKTAKIIIQNIGD